MTVPSGQSRGAASAAPHWPQNFILPGTDVPQWEHVIEVVPLIGCLPRPAVSSDSNMGAALRNQARINQSVEATIKATNIQL